MRVDLNADVGEGYEERDLLPLLTSVNVACGGHTGDLGSMTSTVEAALALGLSIGAHPSYPDREHFGRRELALSPADLESSIREQVLALARVVERAGGALAHVKPHGALYNVAARDPGTARLVACTIASIDPRLRLVGLAGSRLLDAGRAAGVAVAAEGFADRRYAPDGSLAPRSLAGAVIDDPLAAAEQALSIVRDREAIAVGGTRVAIVADTLCVHGDTPRAAAIARAVRERLVSAGIELAPA